MMLISKRTTQKFQRKMTESGRYTGSLRIWLKESTRKMIKKYHLGFLFQNIEEDSCLMQWWRMINKLKKEGEKIMNCFKNLALFESDRSSGTCNTGGCPTTRGPKSLEWITLQREATDPNSLHTTQIVEAQVDFPTIRTCDACHLVRLFDFCHNPRGNRFEFFHDPRGRTAS